MKRYKCDKCGRQTAALYPDDLCKECYAEQNAPVEQRTANKRGKTPKPIPQAHRDKRRAIRAMKKARSLKIGT